MIAYTCLVEIKVFKGKSKLSNSFIKLCDGVLRTRFDVEYTKRKIYKQNTDMMENTNVSKI